MIPIISFIGCSGSGKTTLLVEVIAELKSRGIRVAAIKHTHDHELEFDKKGKDSQRLMAAGADSVIISGPREIALMKKTDHDMQLDDIMPLIDPDFDLVLAEGFKNESAIKIEIYRKMLASSISTDPDQLMAVITDERLDINVPQFNVMDSNSIGVADLIEKWLINRPERDIGILIDRETKMACEAAHNEKINGTF